MQQITDAQPDVNPPATAWEPASVIPPRRLGQLLSTARAAKGWTIADASEASSGRFGHWDLASAERGTATLNDGVITDLCGLYGVGTGGLVPSRSKLIVDLAEGRLWVDETPHGSKVSSRSPREEILARYLAMVYVMRDIEPGFKLTMRDDDVATLGTALRAGRDTIYADLDRLMEHPDHGVSWRARLLSRRVLVPAAGLLVAFCGVGALVVTSSDAPSAAADTTAQTFAPATASSDPQVSAVAPVAEVGTAVVQERNADGSAGAVEIRNG